MKVIKIVLVVLISLLSIAAGAAKLMQVPEEVAFLTGLGLSAIMITLFGGFQVLGGILTLIPKSKMYGAIIVVMGFLASAILVFISGNIQFGMISLVPVVLAGVIVFNALKPKIESVAE